ncbi:MAG TPA: acyl carrier protein [Vicinamibacterales bacterium]|nr:acyl carrier protein [Vicinamibacterales bacterium]
MPHTVDLRDRITRLFADTMHVEVPSVDTDLFEVGALDSLAFVELLLRLEEDFNVRTTADDLVVENFQSISRIAEFVARRSGSTHATPDS